MIGMARPKQVAEELRKISDPRKASYRKRRRQAQRRYRRSYARQSWRDKLRYAQWKERMIRAGRLLRWWRKEGPTATPLPVSLRPWVPHVAETLAQNGERAQTIRETIQRQCTRSQYKSLCEHYPALVAA